ncbi:MAG: serine/threonine-protein kinase [Pseudomonadota bacterium]
MMKNKKEVNSEREAYKDIKPGMIIQKHYCLETVINKGNMSVIWKAVDLREDKDSSNRHLALKFLSQDFIVDRDAFKALVDEFGRYKSLKHFNIVRAYRLHSRTDHTVFMVMELPQGIPLTQFIKNHQNGISLKEAKPIILGMVNALSYAHREGIVHSDLKPANVFYNLKRKFVKVIDFGIARYLQQYNIKNTVFFPNTNKSDTISTPYASFEILFGVEPRPRDDVYALACTVYELLSGKPPFNGKNAAKAEYEKLSLKRIKGLNRQQHQALLRALSLSPEERTSSVEQFSNELFTKTKKYPLIVGIVLLLATVAGILALFKL